MNKSSNTTVHAISGSYFVHYGQRVMCKCGHVAKGHDIVKALEVHRLHVAK